MVRWRCHSRLQRVQLALEERKLLHLVAVGVSCLGGTTSSILDERLAIIVSVLEGEDLL